MIPAPTYTRDNILNQVAKISCCSASLAYALTQDEAKGVKACKCSWSELEYLTRSQKTLEDYYPEGAIINEQVQNVAVFYVGLHENITNAGLLVDGNLITSDFSPFTNTQQMIGAIVSDTLADGYVASQPSAYILVVTAPFGILAGAEITLVFDYNDSGAESYLETAVFTGGAYAAGADDCLTPSQVQTIFESTTKICGCSECTQNEDSIPSPNSTIVVRYSYYPLYLRFEAADFVGNNFTPTGLYSLIGKTAGGATPDFYITSDGGSGTVITYPDQYQFDSPSGTLIFPSPDSYALTIVK